MKIKKFFKKICFILAAIFLLTTFMVGCDKGKEKVNNSMTIFYGVDNKEALHNPLMGWAYCAALEEIVKYGIPDEFDVANVFCSWDKLEPQEGVFDFELLNQAIKRLRNDNKTIHLRLHLMPEDVWDSKGYPDWLKSVPGIGEFKLDGIKHDMNGTDYSYAYYHPPYESEIYQGKVQAFLNRVAQEFPDGTVDSIDLRAYSLYGEWDAGWGEYWERPLSPEDQAEKEMVLSRLVEIYANAFGHYDRTLIALNVPSTTIPNLPNEDPELYYKTAAFDKAKEAGFTIRIDGIGSTYQYDMFYEWLRNEHFEYMPIFSETWYGWAPDKHNVEATYDSFCKAGVNTATYGFFRSNYQDADMLDYDFYTETLRPSKIFNNQMIGYRIIPTQIKFSKEAAIGGKIRFESTWENTGSGILYNKYPLMLCLVDKDGNEVYRAIRENFDLTKIKKDSGEYKFDTVFNLPGKEILPAGEYTVNIALVDTYNNNRSAIALPLGKNSNDVRDYAIGKITIK